MLSTATIRRKTGAMVTLENGLEVPEWIVVYTGPCRIRGAAQGRSSSRRQNIGGVEIESATPEIHLPWNAVVVDGYFQDGDLADVGQPRVLRLEGDPDFVPDQQTARRVPVVATERPEEWGA